MDTLRKLPFELSDVVLVLFIHDIEKLWTCNPSEGVKIVNKELLKVEIIKKYKLVLEEDHLNALKYIHGKGSDYNSILRVQTPLAAFVHCCDTLSARVWFDYPKKNNSW